MEQQLNLRYCRKCKTVEKVVGFERDDPILSCGHVKRRTLGDSRVDKCRQEIRQILSDEPAPVKQAFFEALFDTITSKRVGYCPICDSIVSIITENGIRKCGGNLYDNAGCGHEFTGQLAGNTNER